MIRDIALDHGADPALAGLRPYQHHALEAIASCGTIAAGLHVEVCDHCGDQRMVPNTCGHRSCPHCLARERAKWVEARTAEMLPCNYFQVVFTLPPKLRSLSMAFPAVVLDVLMRASSDAIDQQARSQRFLGAEVGQLAILHTWTRDLRYHPHVHVMTTAGGIGGDPDNPRWVDARRYGKDSRPFLVPVDVLRDAFRRFLRKGLLRAYDNGELPWEAGSKTDAGADAAADARQRFVAFLDLALDCPIVIRIEPPFGSPELLLKYLGAYVNRAAVSPGRVTYDRPSGMVTLHWKANAAPDVARETTMTATEFLLLFAQHILPPRFHRIRFRGLWCTAHRATKLDLARRLLGMRGGMAIGAAGAASPPFQPPEGDLCTRCGLGHYQRLPGPVQRPRSRERRRLLAEIRGQGPHPTHGGNPTAA
jgi:hypothetical protein